MQKNISVFAFLLALGALLLFPTASFALEGTHADDVKVKFYARQGDKWFKACTKRADEKGVLKLKNVLPGWYEVKLDDDDDAVVGQKFAAKCRMVDREGRRLKEDTKVDLYYKNASGDKTFVAELETDEDGWLELSGAYAVSTNVKYYFDIDEDDGAHLKSKDGRARVKVKAKIKGSDWFQARYERTDESNILEIKNVLPGKYKFSYKKDDRTADQPFNLKIRMSDEDGAEIKKATKVKLYVYQNKLKILVGELKTDKDGWLLLPNTMTKMKYKLSI